MKMLLNTIALVMMVQASPALAQADTRAVSYADLDLSQSAGQAALESRLRSAVRQVCGDPGVRDLKEMYAQRACRSQALAKAKADMTLAIRAHSTVRVAEAGRPKG